MGAQPSAHCSKIRSGASLSCIMGQIASMAGCDAEHNFSDEEDEPRNTAGPQPGNKIEFPGNLAGTVIRRTANGFKVRFENASEDDEERWFPLSGLAGGK